MKKSKLLIPALSIASVGAVVAPMVTSCSSKAILTVTETTFKGTVHDTVTEANAWDQMKATEEYFKDTKNIAEDIATDQIQNQFVNPEFTAVKKNAKVNSVKFVMNDLTVGKNVVYNGYEGYLLSGSFSMEMNISYEMITPTSPYTKEVVEETVTGTFSFNDCFAYVKWQSQEGTTEQPEYENWALVIEGDKEVSTNWTYAVSGTQVTKTTYTNSDGQTKVKTENADYSINAGALVGTGDGTILGSQYGSFIPSNYLSKVAHAE